MMGTRVGEVRKFYVPYCDGIYGAKSENGDEIEVEVIAVVDKEERGDFGVC